ncbi:MAG: HyaD/HybD family hydrogenase maturation endopeptidase [Campylobacter sp.]|nr:HyaD/HybD family hydrogenase maturation endopeptidase [Campylobacter sp.]
MKILVLGIGNVMFGDEGVGVHFVNMLRQNYSFSHESDELDFVDGGTLAMTLSPIITSADKVVVVDCISADDAVAGDAFFFDYDAIPPKLSWSGSAHEVEMLETLQFIELSGDLPPTKILAIIPTRIEPMCFSLSDEVKNGVKLLEKTLLDYLSNLGFSYQKISNFSIQDIANDFAKGMK